MELKEESAYIPTVNILENYIIDQIVEELMVGQEEQIEEAQVIL